MSGIQYQLFYYTAITINNFLLLIFFCKKGPTNKTQRHEINAKEVFMKLIIAGFFMVSFFNLSAFASENSNFDNIGHIDVHCIDADKDLNDVGHTITIQSGGTTGAFAVVSETTPVGPVVRGFYEVNKTLEGTDLFYSAKGFDLQITLESFAPTEDHYAVLTLSDEKKITTHELFCNVK